MHNFSWIVPDQLAGMGYPMAEDIDLLKQFGITAIVSLTIRKPDGLGDLQVLRLPIPDMSSPSVDHLDEAVSFTRRVIGESGCVAVHCGAGVGRTGTVLAAYLVAEGLTPDAARQRIRELRPGSIETHEHEQTLNSYAHLVAERES